MGTYTAPSPMLPPVDLAGGKFKFKINLNFADIQSGPAMIIVPQCSWFFVLGRHQFGSLKTFNLTNTDMKIDEEYFFEHKLNYLKLALKISKLRYKGSEPPKELLQQAREVGQRAGISEQELKNL